MRPLIILGCSLLATFASALPAQAQTIAGGRVELALTMRLHDGAGLEALIRAQSDPRSPLYAHFLSPAQFETTFAPTPTEYVATIARLRQEGVRVERTYKSRIAIIGSAPAAIAHRVFAASASSHRSYDVPHDLTSTVAMVVAGDATESKIATASSGLTHKGITRAASSTTSALYGPDGGFGPLGVTVANDFPVIHGYSGTGVKVADVTDNSVSDGNVGRFLTQFGIARTGPPTVDALPAVSTDLFQSDFDAEWILGTAPGVSLYTYGFDFFLNPNFLAAITQVVDDNVADIVNVSFAACESDDTLALALAPVLTRAAAQGMTFEGITYGGANPCLSNLSENEVPSGDDHVLAVSGTNAVENNDGTLVAQSAFPQNGSGVSVIFPLPSWQRHIPGITLAGRNTPDIVLVNEVNSTGPSAYTSFYSDGYGYPTEWDGGALSHQDPIFVNNAPAAGMLAGIQQMVGHRLGAFNQTLYALFAANGYGVAFQDITVGCNTTIYDKPSCAKPGYDLTAGIGTIDAYQVGKLLH
jgi:subtilase family serine protease